MHCLLQIHHRPTSYRLQSDSNWFPDVLSLWYTNNADRVVVLYRWLVAYCSSYPELPASLGELWLYGSRVRCMMQPILLLQIYTPFVWYAVQTTSEIVTHWPARCPSVAVFNCWRPSFRCGWCSTMEQSATWHRREWHTVTFPSWT